ncbi:hypothetical protein RND81_11G104700 [Saponaria officinalis]|uniref:SWIM-type domain-containing protein n=1 Tax=Saponaria officinalis TaxID=3572 RepID=A0AAW1HKB2_SAPOF
MNLQGVAGDEFCRIVESQFTPFIGQKFLDLEEVVVFYKIYALACGFDVRRYTTKKWRDGTVKSKLLVCNRQGFTYAKKVHKEKEFEGSSASQDGELILGDKQRRKTKVRRIGCQARIRVSGVKGLLVVDRFRAGHNHELVEVKDRHFQKLARRLHKYHKELILKIGATKTYKMCKEHVNGFENIGASLNDFKKFHRDVKCYINVRDGQLFIDRFKNLADTRDDFYFDYEVDVDNSLVRAVWADSTARRNYAVFGDAVSFKLTYSTNKYSMVFTPFTGVDNHKRSVTFCGALLFRENEESFTWLFKLPVKYGSNAKDYPDFLRKLNVVVWDDELEADAFDVRWAEIMAKHGVGQDRDWFQEVFKIRRQWVLAHCRDLIMGSVLRTTQRSESENSFVKKFENNSGTLVEFWMRFKSALDQQRHTQKKLDSEYRHSAPKLLTQQPIEIHGARVYTHELFEDFQQEVISSTSGLSARGFYERNGVEITNLKDTSQGKVFDIGFNPGTYQVTCTCMKFERCGLLCRHVISILSSNGVNSIPDVYIELTKLWSELYETVGLLKAGAKEDIETLCSLIREFRGKLDPTGEDLTKEQEIERLLGCNAVDEIKILPPKLAKNKGSGKRMLSSKTVAVAIKMAHHDKRNCPNPYAERPPPMPESSSDAEDNDEEVEEDNESE